MSSYQLTEAAELDLLGIWHYVFEIGRSPERAESVIDRLYDAFEVLADNPLLGRAAPRLGDGVRGFAVQGYVVAYRVVAGVVVIARISGGDEDILHDL